MMDCCKNNTANEQTVQLNTCVHTQAGGERHA